jgi:hypothetical protein
VGFQYADSWLASATASISIFKPKCNCSTGTTAHAGRQSRAPGWLNASASRRARDRRARTRGHTPGPPAALACLGPDATARLGGRRLPGGQAPGPCAGAHHPDGRCGRCGSGRMVRGGQGLRTAMGGTAPSRASTARPVPAPCPSAVEVRQRLGGTDWAQWQSSMRADFDRVLAFSGTPDLRRQAWERFLEAWRANNPHTLEDEDLRRRASELKEQAARLAGSSQPSQLTAGVSAAPPATSDSGRLPA